MTHFVNGEKLSNNQNIPFFGQLVMVKVCGHQAEKPYCYLIRKIILILQ